MELQNPDTAAVKSCRHGDECQGSIEHLTMSLKFSFFRKEYDIYIEYKSTTYTFNTKWVS